MYKNSILKKIFIIFLLLFTQIALGISQTGPGGVGNSNGANGQPANVLWLDASSLSSSDGNDLTTWTDISGNGNNLTQSNTSYTPIFQDDAGNINGHPRIEFSKSNNRIVLNPFNNMPSSGITTFWVYKTTGSNDALLSYATTSSDNEFLLFNNNNLTTYFKSNNTSSGKSFNSGNWEFMSHEWQSSNGDLKINQNGDQLYSTVFQNGHTIANGGSFVIGGEQDAVDGSYDAAQAFYGDIAEVIMYNSSLNTAQRIIVENYLSQKYAINFSTPANDKYTGNDASYVHNIAGIGKESDGSQSQSSSAGLYIYERNSSLANGEYVMFAHNNAANSSSTVISDASVTTCGAEAAWNRNWYIDTTSSDGIDIKMIFDFKEALTDGQYPNNVGNYVLLYKNTTTGNYSIVSVASQGIADADQVYFNVDNANLSDGYYTIGTLDQTNSPLAGTSGKTWYALASGDWDNWEYWTLDPSGALPNNPNHLTPASIDKVVIQTGKTISLNSNNKTLSSITVDGILDIGTTSGHNFTVIKGSGRIKLKSDNFPTGDATDFVTKGLGEGTVVWQGNSYNLSTAHTFYNMEVELQNTTDVITLLANYTINGHLYINNGILKINDNSSTTNLNINIYGNLSVETNGQLLTGSGNARHQLNLYSDFTNNGTTKFTNRTSANYGSQATDGIVDANFINTSEDQTILCNGTTNFYRIEIDKGIDDTYILDIQATNPAYFNLFGYAAENHSSVAQLASNANALGLIKGTAKIESNVNIPVLSTASNYNISEAARIWVNGGTVQKNSGNAIVPYGVLEVSNGLCEAKVSSGITLRENGVIKISGGTINTNQIRTSVLGASNVGGYVQSGGTVNIVNPTNTTTDYYHFCLTYPGNVFNMSGGTLHIYDANGNTSTSGGIFIASDPQNVNVTGGTVIAEIASTTNPFKITSKAHFWNLILRNTYDSSTDHLIDSGYNVGATDENLSAQTLVVLNDLTIEQNCFLDHNGNDITIGGNFSIDGNSQKQGTNNYGLLYNSSKPNTLTFNGSNSDTLYIGHNIDDKYELYLWNLNIEKQNDGEIVLKGDPKKDPTLTSLGNEWHNRLVNVQDTIDVESGTLNQGHQSIRLYATIIVKANAKLGVYIPGTTPLSAYIMLKDDQAGTTDLSTEKGAELGNFKLNPGDGNYVGLLSDVYIKRIGYFNGSMNLRTFNLKVDYLNKNSTTNSYPYTASATDNMIYGDGNASDGGLTIKITGNGNWDFPIGTKANDSTRYTWVRATISNFVDTGYITITPVDQELRTIDKTGGNHLSYYWAVRNSDFSTLPTVSYQMKYYDYDLDGASNENLFVPGRVLSQDPFTRLNDNDKNKVDDNNDIITFDTYDGSGTITLENANYTAGKANCFNGSVPIFKSIATYSNWDDKNTWDANKVPTSGSIVIIQNGNRVWANNIPEAPGAVIFERDYSNQNPSSENIPRLQFNTAGTFDIGVVSGTGMISLNTNVNPTVIADWGQFADNDTSVFMYWGTTGGFTLTNIPQPVPNLMLESDNFTINQNLKINDDLIFNGNSNATFVHDVEIGRDLVTGFWRGGTLHFPASGSAITITVGRNIDYTQYDDQGSARKIIVNDPGTASTLTHKLIVKGDINLGSKSNYVLDIYNAADRPNVILELQGKTNNRFYRTSTVVPDLYRIVMNKGNSQVDTFSFDNSIVVNGPTSGLGVAKAIELQNGTLKINDTAININLTTGDDNFNIPASSCLEMQQGNAFANGNSGIILDGKLKITGGSVDMSGGDNFIQYSASGNATIDISSGSLIVGSQIRRGTASNEGILTYNQSGGTVELGKNAATISKRGIFEILNTGSSFNFSGGTFSIANDYRSNPTTQSFYFDPENSSISNGLTINFGSANTSASNGNFTIYASKNLQNLTLDSISTNKVYVKMEVVPLNISGNLDIQSGNELDANGLNLNTYGNFTNSGTFTATQNNTYFKGSSDQTITGNTTFYNFINENSSNLLLDSGNTELIIDNKLTLNNGTNIKDNGNNIFVYGDINNEGTHTYGGSGDGISLVGSSEQVLTGNGHFGKLSINNPTGITVPVGNTFTIDNYLKLFSGILNIGGNLLILAQDCQIIEANPFGNNNMIQTNISFTDNGVKKYFPSGVYNFTYPIGSGGKYTPVKIDITKNSNSTYLIAKSSNEIHPSIQEDSETPNPEITDKDNVLQYYWTLVAKDFTDFSGTVEMYYDTNDVKVTTPYTIYDYITAKLLNDGTGNWYKFNDVSKFDETNKKLIFDFDNNNDKGITGDYTAGVDGSSFNGAIPDQVPLYISNGSGTRLNWHDAATWTHDPGLPDYPQGARVKILSGDTVYTNLNYISTYTTEISGEIDVNTTFGNRLGNVSGTGTIFSERGTLPAGYYEAFVSDTGGTFEFSGNTDYSILSNITQVNNLKFTGTGKREFPNLNLQILGNLEINGTNSTLQIINEFNKKISVAKNIIFNNGSFDAGIDANAIFEINGTYGRQTITGTNSFTGSNAFNYFEMNNNSGLLLAKPIDIEQNLSFFNGIIYSDNTNILKLTNTSENIVSGAGSNEFVDGPISKNFNTSGSFIYPIGDNSRYGSASVINSSVGGYWIAEYLNHNPINEGYDPAKFNSPLQLVSSNEYWRIKAPSSADAKIKIRWDSHSGVPTDATNRSDLRIAKWTALSPDKWTELDANNTISGDQNNGTITQNSNTSSFNEFTNGDFFTISSLYTPTSLTWTGSNSIVWNDASNWSPAKVPTSVDSITIPSSGVTNEPTINIEARCKGIDLQSGRTLTINTGKNLTTFGDFNLNGTLILKSPSNNGPSASFIDDGTITGTGTMRAERYLTGGVYHYISSPIENGGNANSNLFTTSNPSGNYNANFYYYDETFDLDGNPSTAPPGVFSNLNSVGGWAFAHNNDNGAVPVNMDIHTGYAFYTDLNQLVTFIGKPNTGDLSYSGLSYTSNDPIPETFPSAYDGWHLVANPYPSSIDWNVIKTNLTNIDEGIYVWDGTQYASYINGIQGGSGNLTNEIAPMQAFFIHTNNANAGFKLDNSARIHSTHNYLKKDKKSEPENIKKNFIDLKLVGNGHVDLAAIYFTSQATDEFDNNLEAYKMFSPDYIVGVPHIFSISGKNQTPMSINAIPEEELHNRIIPIGIRINTSGTYTIYFDKFNFDSTKVYFIDNQEKTETCVNDIRSYTFNFNAGDDRNRFELKFIKNTNPLLNIKIKDKYVYEDSPMKLNFDYNTFIDYDKGDAVTYSASLLAGNPLPSWLSFDSQKLSFTGTPNNDNVGTLAIKLIATDNVGASSFTKFNLNIINVNDTPKLKKPLPDEMAYVYNFSSFKISDNSFIDIDLGDSLTYSATLENGSELPQWLNFDPESKTFSGIPENIGDFAIKVATTDQSGASSSDVFKLTVNKFGSFEDNQILVFPNPTSGLFNIANFAGTIIISDISGKEIINRNAQNYIEKFDISNYPKGTYFIKLISEDKTSQQLIIKE